MEFCYGNNSKSLFRKYAKLLTWFANTPEGRELLRLPFGKEIGLFLPNGYHKIIDRKNLGAKATFYTRPIYAPLLYPVLHKLDLMCFYLRDFEETQKVLLWSLGLNKKEIAPRILRQIFHDTATLNPDANPESTSVDGIVGRDGVNENFATIRSGAGTASDDTADGNAGTNIRMFAHASSGGSGNLQALTRSITLFDTSSLNDAAVINSAIASLYFLGRNISFNNFSVCLVRAIPASNTALVNSDFNIANWDMTTQSDIQFPVNSLALTAYNDFTLNATGKGNIDKTGISKFGWVSHNDRTNADPGFSSNSQDDRCNFEYADHAGGHDPKLIVDYTVPGGFFHMSV